MLRPSLRRGGQSKDILSGLFSCIDGDDAGDGRSRIASDAGAPVTFINPAESLTVEAGVPGGSGADVVDVTGLDATFDADLTINGVGDDTVNFTDTAYLGTGDLHATGGSINVDGTISSQGATVHLDAGAEGTLFVSGTIDVSDTEPGQSGGTIRLLGACVGLVDAARIDASGDAGGGTVLIGGDYQGNNPDIPNALQTYVGSDVNIVADALSNGDGGTVIVWADEITRFHGDVSARGGERD